MTVIHQTSDTHTSDGLACIAMLIGYNTDDVLRTFHIRASDWRKRVKKTNHDRITLFDMLHMLKHYEHTLGRRFQLSKVKPGDFAGSLLPPLGLIRVHQRRFESDRYHTTWHWLVISGGMVHDPDASRPQAASMFFSDHRHDLIYFYEVQKA